MSLPGTVGPRVHAHVLKALGKARGPMTTRDLTRGLGPKPMTERLHDNCPSCRCEKRLAMPESWWSQNVYSCLKKLEAKGQVRGVHITRGKRTVIQWHLEESA